MNQGKNVERSTRFIHSCIHSNLNISYLLLNDLVFDCPYKDDEPELLNNLQKYNRKCAEMDMYECYPGHSKYYIKDQKCMYNITRDTQTLMYCRNGQHLQNCENTQCKCMFKCPNSYCIPYRYMCDGKWDCWNVEDEFNCKDYLCVNMFKCKFSSICILKNNVCDGITDSPLGNDEIICIENSCIDSCQNENLLPKQHLFTFLHHCIFIHITNSTLPQTVINGLRNVIILISTHNNIHQPFPCSTQGVNIQIMFLDLRFNKIRLINKDHFTCLPNLTEMNLAHNEIRNIPEMIFNTLSKLKTLNLNSNKVTSLLRCAFCGLEELTMLNLMNNAIVYVDIDIFDDTNIHVIITDGFHVCCMHSKSRSIYTAKPLWCDALISTIGLKLLVWFVGLLVVMFNLLSISSNFIPRCKRKLTTYDKYVMAMSDFMVGLYLLSVAITDRVIGDNYVGSDLLWKRSVPCNVMSFMSLLAILMSALFLLALSISRYKVIKSPLSSKGAIVIEPLVLILFVTLILFGIYLRHQVKDLSYLSSPLCIQLGKSEKSEAQNITTMVASLYQLFSLIIILILYVKLRILSNKSGKFLSEQKQKQRQKAITTNVILVGTTNTICWLPSSVFHLVSVFGIKSPVYLLYWMTLLVLPINSMINPILFNTSKIESLRKYLWSRLKGQIHK